MQPTPSTRNFTQKGILQFICKLLGLLFVLQVLMSAQKVIAVDWVLNNSSRGNVALAVELFSNAAVCWLLLFKSDWIAEKLDIKADEVRVTLGMQELLELIIIIAGLVLTIASASTVFKGIMQFVSSGIHGGDMSAPSGIFSGMFMLIIGLVMLKHHKRVFVWISKLPQSQSSD